MVITNFTEPDLSNKIVTSVSLPASSQSPHVQRRVIINHDNEDYKGRLSYIKVNIKISCMK